MNVATDTGSFRDPQSRVFYADGQVYRALSERSLSDYRRLSEMEFFQKFLDSGQVIGTELVDRATVDMPAGNWAGLMRHQRIPVITYPYEWSFSMLKATALTQLDLLVGCIEHGFILKDGTPYNVQFNGVNPAFIDVGSFESFDEPRPWIGYTQFLQLNLYPLMLQAIKDVRFRPFLRGSLEGITATDMAGMLSFRDRLRRGTNINVFMNARQERKAEPEDPDNPTSNKVKGRFSQKMLHSQALSLRNTVERLKWKQARSEWADYNQCGHVAADREVKGPFVDRAAAAHPGGITWDVGCNDGYFSRIASQHADFVLAMDVDELTVERLFRTLRSEGSTNITPIVFDMADPSPGLGFRGKERPDIVERAKPNLVLALAVVHHIVIGRNIPMTDYLGWLAGMDTNLVIEFPNRDDPMVRSISANKTDADIHADYDEKIFEALLARHWNIVEVVQVSETRKLYHCATK
ncbi:MAG: class I SAM-dependent methyltransferase [Actinobacteria bacterium]|nr:class I SAM-dependent methyltransferase [Actinomycetota bacterium]